MECVYAQVLVVVTAGWHVLCFDHNLVLMWDQSIKVGPALFCNLKTCFTSL